MMARDQTDICARHRGRGDRILASSLLALSLAAGTTVAAAEIDADDAMEEITVIATRSPQDSFYLPQMVTVVDRARIEDRLPQQLDELFEGIPNVRFDSGARRNGDQPSIRGLGGAGVLILLDGSRQSFLSGHDGRLFLEPELIGKVEVLRGPASALYGSGAMGGVLAFETLRAGDLLGEGERFGGQVKSSLQGVNDEWTVGGIGYGAMGGLDLVGGVTYRSGSDIALGDGTSLAADDENLSSLFKARGDLGNIVDVEFGFVGFDGDAIEPNNAQGRNVGSRRNPLVHRAIRGRTLTGGLHVGGALDLDLKTYYARNANREDEIGSDRITRRRVASWGVRLENRSALAGNGEDVGFIRLTYGGEIYRDDQNGFDSLAPNLEQGGVPDGATLFLGAFVQAEAALRGRLGELLLIPGLRYDRFENSRPAAPRIDADALSPKAAITWRPRPRISLFANWAESFRAPTINEVFADGIHFQIPLGPGLVAPNVFVANPDLRPEDGRTVEFGGGYDGAPGLLADDHLRIKAAYFTSRVDDLIDLEVNFAFAPGCFVPGLGPCNAGTSRNVNRRNARLRGFELEAAYESRRVFARASYSLLRGRDRDTGAFLGLLLPDTLFIDAGVRWAAKGIRTGFRLEVADALKRVNDPADIRPGFEKLDLYLSWEPSTSGLAGWRFDLGVDNVTDAAFSRVFPEATAPGRNAKLAARYAF